jgi:hypothetical protein
MPKGKYTLKEIANTKSKKQTPQTLREQQIKELGVLLSWNHFYMERNRDELSNEKLAPEMLEILKIQISNKDDLLILMSRMLAEIVQLRANHSFSFHVLSQIRNCCKELESIEKITNKGGRPFDWELFVVAKDSYDRFLNIHKRPPTGSDLSNLVEAEMQKVKGTRRKDKHGFPTNRKYLSPRTAQDWILMLPHFESKDSRQELVKSYTS